MAYIEIKNLKKKFDEKEVIKNLNLEINKGDFVSLLGPSGCGKTTILRMIAGFTDPTEGEIVIDGKVVYSSSENIYVKTGQRKLGMVFQSYAVWPHMTVFDNVAYPLKIRKMPAEECKQKTMNILKQVGLDGRENDYPWSLSGGQQQRVALARGLVMEPSVLLLDEPLSNLDVQLRQKLKEELITIQKRTGITVIYVTHDQSEALQMSNKIVVLNKGNVEQIGTPAEIYRHPSTVFTAGFIGKMNFLQTEDRTIGIRPEDISISRSQTDSKYQMRGILHHTIFEGNRISYVFQTEKEFITAECISVLDCQEGDELWLNWEKQHEFLGQRGQKQ